MSKKITVALIIATPLLCLLFFSYDPANSSFFPRCVIYQFTGIKCPGCGLQRALHQMLHLNLLEAIRYNFFLVLAIPLLAFHGTALVLGEKFKFGQKVLKSNLYPKLLCIMVVSWVVLRNIFGW